MVNRFCSGDAYPVRRERISRLRFLDSVKRVLATGDRPVVSDEERRGLIVGCRTGL